MGIREDLIELGAAAVLGRAVTLGATLVLPHHLVITLPEAELRAFDVIGEREWVTRTLRRVIAERVHGPDGERPCSAWGDPLTVVGGDHLVVLLVAGAQREADARFAAPPAMAPGGTAE